MFQNKKEGWDFLLSGNNNSFKGESTRKTNLSYVNNFYGAMKIFVKRNFAVHQEYYH